MAERGTSRSANSRLRPRAIRLAFGVTVAAALLALTPLLFDGDAARHAPDAARHAADAARHAPGAARPANDAAHQADEDLRRARDAAREPGSEAPRPFEDAAPAHGRISESGFGAYEVSLAAHADGLIAGWYDTRDGNAEIYLRLLDAAGRPIGPELRVTDDAEQSYEVDLAPLGDGIAVAWYGKRSDQELVARLAYWRAEHGVEWQVPLAPHAASSRNPVVRTAGDNVFVAWIETDAEGNEFVASTRWSDDGRRLDEPLRLAPASANAWLVNAAVDERGAAYVVFDAQVGTAAEELYLVAVNGTSVASLRLTADDGHRSKYPDIDVADGRAALTWFDERDGQREVYLLVEPVDALIEARAPIDTRAERVTYTSGPSIGAYVAWNGGDIGLAWTDSTGGPYQVHFQRFDADGAPLEAIRRVTHSAVDSRIPAIRAHEDGFAVAWNEMWPGPSGLAHDPDARSEIEIAIVR